MGNDACIVSLWNYICGFGIIWKNGVILAIIFAAWELGMAFVAIFTGGDSAIRYMSVIGWGMIIVDAGVAISWPDNWQLIEIGLWGGGHGEENWLGEMAYVHYLQLNLSLLSVEVQTSASAIGYHS